jgi:hypothetical protein
MSEASRFNRFPQFAYPTFVFLSFLLVCNSVQVSGFADSHMPGLEPNRSIRSPAQVQNSCSADHMDSVDARSCGEESSQPWKQSTNPI